MAAVIALGTAGVAFASSGEKENANEISAVLNAKTSISQAVAAAEKRKRCEELTLLIGA
tara:strand:- start:3 stop:179 length:177 start_codon:yes stop_codon:yes gene_type:complete